MKCGLLILILFFATNLIQNANSVGERGQESKLCKSFDEIFGKGWDDESNDSEDLNSRHVKEEVQDGQDPNTSDQKNIDEILKQKFDEIYDENWSEDENNSAPDQDESDEHQNESNGCEKIESDQQKREIIQKFREIKEDYKKNRKYPNNEWVQIESKISNSLGVNRTKLYKWKKELGLSREIKLKSKVSEFERRKIVEEFIKKKNEYKQKGKYSHKEWDQNNSQIAKSVGVGINTIKNWKKEFGVSQITQQNDYSDQQKREILDKYCLLIEKYKQKGKHSTKEWNKIYAKISMSVGVGHKTIKKWKKEFGLTIGRKLHSNQEKREKLKQYCEIKKSNPKIRDFEIAERFNIGGNTLKQWKRELKNAVKDENDFSLQSELDQITQLKVYSDQQKREILKQFDEIKSKCMKAILKNISMRELDDKIAKKLGLCARTIYEWKRKFGISVSKKNSDITKIEILKKYATIKGKHPKMSDCDIVALLNISRCSLNRWKAQFSDQIKHL